VADSVLVVADPSFPPRQFPGLSRLPAARAEGFALAGLYPRSAVLSAEAASTGVVLAALGRHPVVHVAAHAVPSPGDPRLSYLVLSDGPLYARQVAERRLEEARVVVLAACSTGRRSESAGEGLAGLSQAFLEAGAAAVVGTLWSVDDRASALLTATFHQNLLADADPATALRSAKLERLRAGDPPAVWAAFELIGATVPRRETQ
jgi:CHAT domain-containing protein